ncbi:MAG TPA: hypothetical protein VLX85_17200, partial [Stellaceae bacterium]|nr:hypothetical protein [Stellaceae bacterium]
ATEPNPALSTWLALTRPLTALSSPSFVQLEPLICLWRETRGALTGDVDAALRAGRISQRMVLLRRQAPSSRLVFERIGGGFAHIRPCEGMLAIGRGFDEVPDRHYGARQGEAYMETGRSRSIRIESVRALVSTSDGALLNTRYDRVLLPWRDRNDQFVMGVSLLRELTIWRGDRWVPFRSG